MSIWVILDAGHNDNQAPIPTRMRHTVGVDIKIFRETEKVAIAATIFMVCLLGTHSARSLMFQGNGPKVEGPTPG
jgi:hypothetical protein